MIELGFEEKKLYVINNSLDYNNQIVFRNKLSISELNQFKKKLFLNSSYKQLLFIGRLTKQKNINLLIDTLSILKSNGYYFNLLLVGDGEEKEMLRNKVYSLALENNINFYGASYNEEINYKLIASSDCCISPGEVGLTAIHSLMYGTPIITHNCFDRQGPEFEAIIPQFNGAFFNYGDANNLGITIIQWFKSHLNRKEVQRNCYKIVDEKFNPIIQKNEILRAILAV